MPTRFWMARSSDRIFCRSLRSSAESGSSRSRTSGSIANARAIATRWRCPPESSWTFLSPWPSSATSPSNSSARARLSAFEWPRTSSEKEILSATDINGNNARFWKISEVGRLLGPMPDILAPPISTCPCDGSKNPEMVRRIVVLPQPDGPRKLKNSPFLIITLTSFAA